MLVSIGLPTLRSVGGSVRLLDNVGLTSIGLDGLDVVAGDLDVVGNTGVPQAVIDAWLATVDVSGTVSTSGNGP